MTTSAVSFACTPHERALIVRILDRVAEGYRERKERELTGDERISLAMDLEAVHSNDVPLDFEKLLKFDAFNFVHDINGITACIDRKTGKLTKCFLPRCARSAKEGQ